MIGIYSITCSKNNCMYIGSSNNIKRRWTYHRYLLKHNKHTNSKIQNYYNKYGLEAFVFSVLEECSIDVLLEREQFYLDTLKPEFNLVFIAGRTTGMKHTDIAKYRISIAHKGKTFVMSEEQKQKISTANKGRKRVFSEEHRDKLSIAGSKRKISEKSAKAFIQSNINRKGEKRSEEVKKRMSDSQKRRYARDRNL